MGAALPRRGTGATARALGAVGLWATLAPLGVSLAHLPPFLLTGLALVVGSMPAWPIAWRDRGAWRVPASTLLLGVWGLFGFHFLLFTALRTAPPLQANLVNYLWPLLMVVLAPVFLRGVRPRALHGLAALVGFAGAAMAIAGGRGIDAVSWSWGYLAALGSAFVWASYSLLTQRVARFPTAAVGLFGLVSGLLALACHALLEPAARLGSGDAVLIAAMGLGPLGAAFFLWDAALKRGDARRIGLLAYLTPLASTLLLALVTGQPLTAWMGLAALMIAGAALVGIAGR